MYVILWLEIPKTSYGWKTCFDHDLYIPGHRISKMTYIEYDIKFSKVTVWSRWIVYPWYLRRLTQGMRCNEILGQDIENIGKGILNDFMLGPRY